MKVTNARKGKRSISVDKLLKKEKEGTLYKPSGNEQKIAGVVPFLEGQLTGGEAPRPKKKGEVPSREDIDAGPKREDGRGNATTVMGSTNFTMSPDGGGRERTGE